MVEDGAFSHKVDNVRFFLIFKILKGIQIALLIQEFRLNWWSLSGGGSAINMATPSNFAQNRNYLFPFQILVTSGLLKN